ncbi:cell division protein FtsA [Helicobacter saguini]|uniref:Cell division protein FtsA n=1 Tax=Helicobacter saguini TaxID=1548018 RepID=A0A347VTB5_9HELI|nr:cell division protein FtsA [Helicobacter saguini]MWV62166.1 cell division protein FtsA [Helicobacter saguini]MWV67161.1 cell division protein FtsA [Helicobacter saguini]MWV69513.1 cell division protein FtsA [Helicobacter saguini]MWV70936.1 cell division protein FtsA [Helicobacter saguini]TLD92529.1 cell division protein FtsA [Helicobacter saguini]
MSRIILGIDIGSTKVCSIIAETREAKGTRDREVQIIGTGSCKSQGIKKGAITNLEQASKAIRQSLEDAKRMAGVNPKKAIISLSGAHTKGTNSSGIANVVRGEVTIDVISTALDVAKHNAGIPKDSEVVHILPFRFKLDDQDFVEDPIGMTGSSLKVDAHIVTVQKASLENLKRAVMLAGIEVENVVLSSYAASIAVLHDDEKELGVVCIDMGAETSDLMIYDGNSMRYNDFLGVGSNNISNDIARVLNTKIVIAEEIKIKYGNLLPSEADKSQILEVPRNGNPKEDELIDVQLNLIDSIIGARVQETLEILGRSIERSGLRNNVSGIVLTGGMANLKGMREFASAMFSPLSVRLARPLEIGGLFDSLKDSSSSVVVGLILYGAGRFTNYEKDSQGNILNKHNTLSNMIESNTKESSGFEIDLTDLDEPDSQNKPPTDEQQINKEKEKTSFFGRVKQFARDLF